MKKTVLMAVAALMMTININAQEGYEDTKHEVSIALGVGSTSQLLDDYDYFGCYSKNEKYIGPISAEYFYHINKWLGIGSIFVYGNYKEDLYYYSYGNGYYYDYTHSSYYGGKSSYNYYTLLPAVKFNFVRKTHFGLYSKAALGVTLRTESLEFEGNNDYNDKDLLLNWQLSFIGVEVGSPYLRGFAELGFGEQGILSAGIRYKF